MENVYWDKANKNEVVLTKCQIEKIEIQGEKLRRTQGTFFDSAAFHHYHERFVQRVVNFHLLEDKGSQYKLIGLMVMGQNEMTLRSPYAAPFATLMMAEGCLSQDTAALAEAVGLYAEKNRRKVEFALTPSCYEEDYGIKLGACMDAGYSLRYAHVSNYFDLASIESAEDFLAQRPHSFRKNIKRAKESNLHMIMGQDFSTLQRAYQVIAKNREERGFPLSMSFDHIWDIAQMNTNQVEAFVVTKDEEDLAGALIFAVTPLCKQVVYWGNVESGVSFRPMEYLVGELLRYYKTQGIKVLDIGPSTAEGKISHGLYRFKKTIGCKETLKFVLSKSIEDNTPIPGID